MDYARMRTHARALALRAPDTVRGVGPWTLATSGLRPYPRAN